MWRIMGLSAIREGFRLTVMSVKRALILRRMPVVLWESGDCPQFNEDGEVFKEADGICVLSG